MKGIIAGFVFWVVIPVMALTWVTVLPTIGLLWALGALK